METIEYVTERSSKMRVEYSKSYEYQQIVQKCREAIQNSRDIKKEEQSQLSLI